MLKRNSWLFFVIFIGACSNAKFAAYQISYKQSFVCQCLGMYYPDTVSIRSSGLCMDEIRQQLGDTKYSPAYLVLVDSLKKVIAKDIRASCDYDFPIYPDLLCVSGYCLDVYNSKTLSQQAQAFAKACKHKKKKR